MGLISYSTNSLKLDILSQNDSLIEWLTVEENIQLNNYSATVAKLIKSFKLNGFEKNYPKTLSAGMRKRVLLASSIVQNPDIVFLDEAFSGLDLNLKLELTKDIIENNYLPETYVLVTHDIMESIMLANRIIILSERPSSIKAEIEIKKEFTNPYQFVNSEKYQQFYSLIFKELILNKK